MASEGVDFERLVFLSSHKAFCFIPCGSTPQSTLEYTALGLTCGTTFFDKAER